LSRAGRNCGNAHTTAIRAVAHISRLLHLQVNTCSKARRISPRKQTTRTNRTTNNVLLCSNSICSDFSDWQLRSLMGSVRNGFRHWHQIRQQPCRGMESCRKRHQLILASGSVRNKGGTGTASRVCLVAVFRSVKNTHINKMPMAIDSLIMWCRVYWACSMFELVRADLNYCWQFH
jgi:hypothetical protein